MARASTGPTTSQVSDSHGCRYDKFDDSPESTHRLVVELVPPGATVLEFGPATGYMSRVLKKELGCQVVGIEIDARAAELAREYADDVIVGNAEELDLETTLGEQRFDAVLFADVLEHLRDPAEMLKRVAPFVAEGGSVIASIPNVAHASVRLALLAGEFRYRDSGLLDRTHLRFFTRAGIEDLFEGSGYVIMTWRRRRLELSDAEIKVPASVSNEAQGALASDPEASTYQFVIRAVPSDAASQLKAFRDALRDDRESLEAARDGLGRAQAELASLKAELAMLRRVHDELKQRLLAERIAFGNHLHELLSLLEPRKAELAALNDELEWRKEVMSQQEEAIKHQQDEIEWRKSVMEIHAAQLSAIQSSPLFRYSSPARRIVGRLRRRR